MKISVFNGYKSTTPMTNKDIGECLDDIKFANSKERVLKVRASKTSEEKADIKSRLFQYAFGGVFKHRSKDGLKTASGLAILDYDEDIEDAVAFRDLIATDPHTLSAFVSTSGRGVKALIRIPAVNSDDEYKSYWVCVRDHYQEKYHKKVDESGKDICRMCCETYDPNIYVNMDAELFTKYHINQTVYPAGDITNIPIEDQDVIANNLMVWFEKNIKGRQGRNSSTHILAAAFNDFGVPKSTAYDYLYQFEEQDFKKSEIKTCIDSAYKKTHQFGTKAFEDQVKVSQIKTMVLNGRSSSEIADKIGGDQTKIEQEIERQKERILSENYWTIDDKGKPIFKPLLFKYWLQRHGFHKYYPVKGTDTFAFIRKIDDFVEEVYENQIKDFVLEFLESEGEVKMYDQMATCTSRFSSNFLSIMANIEFSTLKDTEKVSYLYFRNGILEVTPTEKRLIPYSEIKEMVWKKQIINREYTGDDHHESEYREFIWLISGKDVPKYNTMKSVIGYFLNNYKDSADNRAIVLNDSNVNGENPEGGSGKGIFFAALEFLKKVTIIDGKSFNPNGSFVYQTVSVDTQILVYDDVDKNFKFEKLFSVVTGGITIEYKGQPALKLPVEDSPKIGISTNYGLKGVGGSFERRKFEVALSDYFNARNTPKMHFGHKLFHDWSDLEWKKFDSFMINCLQYYLQNGLVQGSFDSLRETSLMNSINPVVYAYYKEGHLVTGKEYTIKMIQETMEDLILEYQQVPKAATIHKSIEMIEKHLGMPVHTRQNTNGKRWFTLGNSALETGDRITRPDMPEWDGLGN